MFFFLLSFYLLGSAVESAFFEPVSYYRDGDIIIGGLFPLHYETFASSDYRMKPTIEKCSNFNLVGFRWMLAMMFAIEKINNSSSLIPNTTLGWEIFDTCNSKDRTVVQTLAMVDQNRTLKTPSVVLGAATSDRTKSAFDILSVFHKPLISYSATSRKLNRKAKFGSFLRTVPSDDAQAVAIVKLLKHLNWTWIGAIASDNAYGRPGINQIQKEAIKNGICVQFVRFISDIMTLDEIKKTASEIKAFNATVLVAFTDVNIQFQNLLREMKNMNVTDRILIATEAWSTSREVRNAGKEFMAGTLGINIRGGPLPGFKRFVENLTPKSQASNPFLKNFWEEYFNCSCPGHLCKPNPEEKPNQIEKHLTCTGNERLNFSDPHFNRNNNSLLWSLNKGHLTELHKSHSVFVAVQAIAEGLDAMMKCESSSSVLQDGKCPSKLQIEPWQLLAYIRHVNFQPPGKHLQNFQFNDLGDPNVSYKLVTWSDVDSTEDFYSTVGIYEGEEEQEWKINFKDFHFPKRLMKKSDEKKENFDTLLTACSKPCSPGQRKIQFESFCCYGCEPCPAGQISNESDQSSCISCGLEFRPNSNSTACIKKIEDYLQWNDNFGIAFIVLSFIGIIFTTASSVIFAKNKTMPVVKATNYQLSQLMFLAIIFCFISPLFHILKPSNFFCQFRRYLFTLSYTLAVSAVLVKTLRVLSAFEAKLPVAYSNRRRWFGIYVQFAVVALVLSFQVIICVIWYLLGPPQMKRLSNVNFFSDTTILVCNNGSILMMVCSYGYVCLLATIAFIIAFRARKLPADFNEAKFITFAIIFFLLVWGLFIPGYYTTKDTKLSGVVYGLAIYISSYGFLGCLFVPKLYIIFFTPQRNDAERQREATFAHAIKATRSVRFGNSLTEGTLGPTSHNNNSNNNVALPSSHREVKSSSHSSELTEMSKSEDLSLEIRKSYDESLIYEEEDAELLKRNERSRC